MTQKIFLLVPFEIKDNLKKTEKISWDKDEKLWYCETLTNGLEKYELKYINIEYKDKDLWKTKLKSMKWLKDEKIWGISVDDYKIYSSP